MKRTLKDLLIILPHIENFEAWANSLPYPGSLGGHAVPNPEALTLSQYLDLSHVDADALIFDTCRVVMSYKLPDEVISGFDADAVVGLVWHVKKAVERLNAAFESLSPDLSKEEKAAGVPEFGPMGLVDFASKRFNMTYKNAMRLNVWEVWQALKIDHETAGYKKRLQEIHHNKK